MLDNGAFKKKDSYKFFNSVIIFNQPYNVFLILHENQTIPFLDSNLSMDKIYRAIDGFPIKLDNLAWLLHIHSLAIFIQ